MSDPLNCPKCGSQMRSYERNEVIVDQCPGCGGLFLDRGELERLVQAESSFYAATPAPAGQPRRDDRHRDYDHRDDRGDRYRDDDYRGRSRKKKSKRSFLEDFLEF